MKMNKILFFCTGITVFCLLGCDVKTNGTVSVDKPVKVSIDDSTLKQLQCEPSHDQNDIDLKVTEKKFCEEIVGMRDSLCVSMVSDGEKIYYKIVLDSGRTHFIGNMSLAVGEVPVIDICKKCAFKPVITSNALVFVGSANANKYLTNSINSISYSISDKSGIEKYYYAGRVKKLSEIKGYLKTLGVTVDSNVNIYKTLKNAEKSTDPEIKRAVDEVMLFLRTDNEYKSYADLKKLIQ